LRNVFFEPLFLYILYCQRTQINIISHNTVNRGPLSIFFTT